MDECDDDIDDVINNDELSCAVDRYDGMNERSRNPFIHYDADVDDKDSAKSEEDTRAVRESRSEIMFAKSVGGLTLSCGLCRLSSLGIASLSTASYISLVRCVWQRMHDKKNVFD